MSKNTLTTPIYLFFHVRKNNYVTRNKNKLNKYINIFLLAHMIFNLFN
jgi:hypothetical protein